MNCLMFSEQTVFGQELLFQKNTIMVLFDRLAAYIDQFFIDDERSSIPY